MAEAQTAADLAALAVQALRQAKDWLDDHTVNTDNSQASVGGPDKIAEVPAEDAFYSVLVPLGSAARKAVQAIIPELALPDQFTHATRIANGVMVGKAAGSYMARQSIDQALLVLRRQFEELGIMQPVPV